MKQLDGSEADVRISYKHLIVLGANTYNGAEIGFINRFEYY